MRKRKNAVAEKLPPVQPEASDVPLGRFLAELRDKTLPKGTRLLTADEVLDELARRRGGVQPEGR
jgi:hypothetical protein